MKSIIRSIIVILITSTLLWGATQTINTLPVNNSTFIATLQAFLRAENANRFQLKYSGYVFSGGIGTTSGTLTHTISAVTAMPGGYYVYKAATSHTYTASKRTFVYLDYDDVRDLSANFSGSPTITRSTNLVFVVYASGTAEPTVPFKTIPLMQVDTGPTGITAVSDLRPGGEIAINCYGGVVLAVAQAPTKTTLILNSREVVANDTTIPNLAVESGGMLLPSFGITVAITNLLRSPPDVWTGGLGTVVFSGSIGVTTEAQLIWAKDFTGTVMVKAPITLSANLTTTCPSIIEPNCPITLGNYDLTESGPHLSTGLYQQYIQSGTGAVYFGPGSIKDVHPEWWYTGSGSWNTAIQAAINSLSYAEIASGIWPNPDQLSTGAGGGIVRFSSAVYPTTGSIQMHSSVTLRGNGPFSSIISYSGSGKAILMGSGITGDGATNGWFTAYTAIENLGLLGTSSATDGIFVCGAIRFRIENVIASGFSKSSSISYTSVPYTGASFSAGTVVNAGASALHLFDFAIFGQIRNFTVHDSYYGLKATPASPYAAAQCFNAIEVSGAGEFARNVYGMVIGDPGVDNGAAIVGQGSSIHDITVESNTGGGILLVAGRKIAIHHNYFEANANYDVMLGDSVNTGTTAQCSIKDNYIAGGGIEVVLGQQETIEDNDVVGTGDMIRLGANTSYITVRNNRLNGSPLPTILNSSAYNRVIPLVNPQAWTNATLLNSWANDVGTAGYAQDLDKNIVTLRGLIKSGTPPSVAFTLPAGSRPTTDKRYLVSDGGTGVATVTIAASSGDVTIAAMGAGAKASLDEISFTTF